jgi:hypothetical protein
LHALGQPFWGGQRPHKHTNTHTRTPISYLACSWAAILRGAASTPPHPHAPACCLYRRASCSASLATCSLYDAWSGCGRTKGACCCGQILTCMLLGLSSQYHWFWDQCIPESRLKQTPQVCVRFSFNFRHWLILFQQPIAISQSLGL